MVKKQIKKGKGNNMSKKQSRKMKIPKKPKTVKDHYTTNILTNEEVWSGVYGVGSKAYSSKLANYSNKTTSAGKKYNFKPIKTTHLIKGRRKSVWTWTTSRKIRKNR